MKSLSVIYLLLIAIISMADVPVDKRHEVEHLTDFIKNSTCIMNRNGKNHVGTKAIAHIQKKYRHFKDKIKTSEDFITYSATKSIISGKYYTVSCDKSESVKVQDRLLQELYDYRLSS